MLRRTLVSSNTFLTHAQSTTPIAEIRTGPRFWSDPDRMVRMKLMYFSLGLDQASLRRTAVIQTDKYRMRHMTNSKSRDPTGFAMARTRQILTWHKRLQYQELLMQHVFVRQSWRLLRKYPVGGAKIDGVAPQPYFGYDWKPAVNRYTREPLPADAKEIYPRRRLEFGRKK